MKVRQNLVLFSSSAMMVLLCLAPGMSLSLLAGSRTVVEEKRTSVEKVSVIVKGSAAAEKAVAQALERMRTHLEEWGTITVSEPLILPAGDYFDLGKEEAFPGASAYITANKTDLSAAAAQFQQSVLVGQLGGSLQLTPQTATSTTTTTTTTESTAGSN